MANLRISKIEVNKLMNNYSLEMKWIQKLYLILNLKKLKKLLYPLIII